MGTPKMLDLHRILKALYLSLSFLAACPFWRLSVSLFAFPVHVLRNPVEPAVADVAHPM